MTTEFTVFLVDDDPAVLKSLDRLLQATGYRTKAYSSSEAFLHEHDASMPGCVVLDLAMPGLNGRDGLIHIQHTKGQNPRIKILK